VKKIDRLALEYVPIDDLIQHPHNPREGDVGAILQNVEAHGLYAPVVVQRSTNHILKGNHTTQAAKLDGVAEMPVIYVDVDDDQALRILLSDNQVGDQATNNVPILTDLLESLVRSDFGLEGTGFTGDDLDEMLMEFAPPTDAYAEWTDLPSYENEDIQGVFHAVVHFGSDADANDFFARLGKEKTKTFWWPRDPDHKGSDTSKRFVSKGDS
jgi:hypothetical protein